MIITGTDIETTGLKQENGHRIIEICLRTYVDGELKINFVKRCNPHRSIDAKAQAVHGISLADLADEPDWSEIAPTVAKIMSKSDVVVAHNGISFDFPFILAELDRVGADLTNVPILFDTMTEARWATFSGKFPNLGELCFATGIDYDPKSGHAADYDVDVMMKAFLEGQRLGRFKVE